jgi:hypothetical protein
MGSTLQQPIRQKRAAALIADAQVRSAFGAGARQDPLKIQRELKKYLRLPNKVLIGCGKSEKLSQKRVCKTEPQQNAMPKVLESVSNISMNSPRPIQFRSINGSKVLALVLFFVISALSAVFLLLQ